MAIKVLGEKKVGSFRKSVLLQVCSFKLTDKLVSSLQSLEYGWEEEEIEKDMKQKRSAMISLVKAIKQFFFFIGIGGQQYVTRLTK